jgi:hypothetical protein
MQQVRQAADALRQLAVGENRRAINEVLRLLDSGWVIDRELAPPGAGPRRADQLRRAGVVPLLFRGFNGASVPGFPAARLRRAGWLWQRAGDRRLVATTIALASVLRPRGPGTRTLACYGGGVRDG